MPVDNLANYRQLAGLNQFVLGGAQRPFGADAFGDFVLQQLIGRREVGGPFVHFALQLVMRLLQRLAGRQPVLQAAAPLIGASGRA